jgi:hypothetical protein
MSLLSQLYILPMSSAIAKMQKNVRMTTGVIMGLMASLVVTLRIVLTCLTALEDLLERRTLSMMAFAALMQAVVLDFDLWLSADITVHLVHIQVLVTGAIKAKPVECRRLFSLVQVCDALLFHRFYLRGFLFLSVMHVS